MSEKQQHTAAATREKMLSRYGDGLHHKHNKNHSPYRKHFKSHPCNLSNGHDKEEEEHALSTGLVREFNLKKTRKRLVNPQFH